MNRTYIVTASNSHGAHEISTHRSLRAAIRSIDAHLCPTCTCDGPRLYVDDGDGEPYAIYVTPRSYYRNVREGLDLRVSWAQQEIGGAR